MAHWTFHITRIWQDLTYSVRKKLSIQRALYSVVLNVTLLIVYFRPSSAAVRRLRPASPRLTPGALQNQPPFCKLTAQRRFNWRQLYKASMTSAPTLIFHRWCSEDVSLWCEVLRSSTVNHSCLAGFRCVILSRNNIFCPLSHYGLQFQWKVCCWFLRK